MKEIDEGPEKIREISIETSVEKEAGQNLDGGFQRQRCGAKEGRGRGSGSPSKGRKPCGELTEKERGGRLGFVIRGKCAEGMWRDFIVHVVALSLEAAPVAA